MGDQRTAEHRRIGTAVPDARHRRFTIQRSGGAESRSAGAVMTAPPKVLSIHRALLLSNEEAKGILAAADRLFRIGAGDPDAKQNPS